MGWISEKQVAAAREIDLLTYLENREPHELIRSAQGEYRTATHGSLVISKGKWYWNRGQFGGVSALDYLIKMRGMEFVEAVEDIIGEGDADAHEYKATAKTQASKKKWKFYPPKPFRYSNGAISYLQGRSISVNVLRRCVQLGILYESRYYNPRSEYHNAAVCVFAGKDKSGAIKFAAMRGINTDFKKDKAGSDKGYSFYLPAKNSDSSHLAVFEAPIDALSHATLQERDGWGWDGYQLSLGGTSDVALIAFMERNPQIRRVILHLDNDAAGLIAARKIKARLAEDERFRKIRVSINPPRRGKDYNAALQNIIRLGKDPSRSAPRRAAISI